MVYCYFEAIFEEIIHYDNIYVNMLGKYHPATMTDPEQFPDVEIEGEPSECYQFLIMDYAYNELTRYHSENIDKILKEKYNLVIKFKHDDDGEYAIDDICYEINGIKLIDQCGENIALIDLKYVGCKPTGNIIDNYTIYYGG